MKKIPLNNIINGIPHAVAILDEQLRIQAMNSALENLSGYSASEAQGILIDYILRADVGAKELGAAFEDEKFFSHEGNTISAARKKVAVRISASPLKDRKEQIAGLLVFVEDITFLRELDEKVHHRSTPGGIVGHSRGMQEIFELLPVLAATDATVLITGETGTGKDLLAETIHRVSKRAQYPFIKVNCGAIPESLLESELFGHKRGAFTGAHNDKPGMFRLAQGGTIFLTEIGDLPLLLQVKLLTVLDDREFFPLGSTSKTNVDVRIITGTHRDLKQLVQDGGFREDLFYRLNVLRAHLPPLRERGDDIRLLLDHFLGEISAGAKKNIKGFTRKAYDILESYDFPGNIRELRNIVEFAVSMCREGWIDINHLPTNILLPKPPALTRQPDEMGKNRREASAGTPVSNDIPITGASWPEIEKQKILTALSKTNGNRTEAAKLLGCGRSTLWRKIKQHKIG
ncbi:MAG: sigma 54-interacting transcriptional regulator [Desulfurivibrionaceae bacterium]|nr:sigma 54-interacting transcriptional regulator [Desulfurivibrionaceae bacterium]